MITYGPRVAIFLVQGILLHVYNVVGLVLVASVHGARWAVPQILLGVGAILLSGPAK